jgi:8-oxo-dGTP diphosphatase
LTSSKRTDTIEFEVSQMARRQSNQSHEDLFSTGDASPDPSRDRASRSESATLHTPQRIDLQGAASQAGSGEKTRKSVTVVAACILRPGGKEVLLSMRRAPGVPGLDGKWELPGGKIEFGETPEQTIVREIREELGMHVVPRRLLPYLHTNLWEYTHALQHVVLACYECETEDDLSHSAGEDARWFPINQIDFESTLPGTREFVSLVASNGWFDEVFIEFERVEPSRSATKRFTVATQPTLYSRYGLVKYWGTVGVFPRTRTEAFGSPGELDAHIFETARRRLALGYHITAWKGPDRPYPALIKIIELARQKGEYCPRLQ